MAVDDPGAPRWLYLVGAVIMFAILSSGSGALDRVSNWGSDYMNDGIEDMQNSRTTTTSSTTTTTLP